MEFKTPASYVYDFILKYKRGHDGNSPTIREIGASCGINSTSQVLFYLHKLEKQGLIRRPEPLIGTRIATRIEIVGGLWTKETK
jgi:hypothetical protein